MIKFFFRSDETNCNKRTNIILEAELHKFETLYYKMLNDSDVSKLETRQQKIILEGLRRAMCMGKVYDINNALEIDEECRDYIGR